MRAISFLPVAALFLMTVGAAEDGKPSTVNSPQFGPRTSREGQQEAAALLSIIDEADKAQSRAERRRSLRDFTNRSTPLAGSHPLLTNLWIARTAVACEINQTVRAWEGGLRLKALGLEGSSDPRVKSVFVTLEKNGWIGGDVGPDPDVDQSVPEVRHLAEEGDSWFQEILGTMLDPRAHWPSRSIAPDDVESAKWDLRAANGGDPIAQHAMGFRFAKGYGVAKDMTEAVKWYRKAAEGGFPPALCDLGICYQQGIGVIKDEAKALDLFRQAVPSGYGGAMCDLGVCYQNGTGLPQDQTEAARWFLKSAQAGSRKGMCALGNSYFFGYGLAKNETQAAKWWEKSAKAGYVQSMVNIGMCHQLGTGATKDTAQAAQWFRKAADAGSAMGMNFLAMSYEHGIGVDKNEKQAEKWYRKAAEAGDSNAKAALARRHP